MFDENVDLVVFEGADFRDICNRALLFGAEGGREEVIKPLVLPGNLVDSFAFVSNGNSLFMDYKYLIARECYAGVRTGGYAVTYTDNKHLFEAFKADVDDASK